MKVIVILSTLVVASLAFVCPNACDNVKQPVLKCLGSTIKNTGWCGCTDSCAKLEGEECQIPSLLMPNNNQCDEGLECSPVNGVYICVKTTANAEAYIVKRFVEGMPCPDNPCKGIDRSALECKGGRIKDAGWCGCLDVCKKVRGETHCIPRDALIMDGINTEICDDGLVCHQTLESGSICLMPNETSTFVSKRSATGCVVDGQHFQEGETYMPVGCLEEYTCRNGEMTDRRMYGCTDGLLCLNVGGVKYACTTIW